MSAKRRWWRSLLFAIYCVALFVGLGEVVVRISGYSDRYIYDPIYQPLDAEIPYVHKPNLRGAKAWGRTIIDTDALGLRSTAPGEPPAPKRAGEYRIAVLGDSVTFGEGVAGEDTFCHRLEVLLNHAQTEVHVRVFNFGVSAYSVKQMAATLERRALAIDPDFVATVIIPADFDLDRTGTVDDWGYIRSSDDRGEHARLKRVLRRMRLVYFLRDVYDHQTTAWSWKLLDGLPDSYRYVTQIRNACRSRALDCGLVLVSTKIDQGFGPVRTAIEHDGIPVLDLTALRDEFTAEQFDAGKYDPHPSAVVHHRIAERLASWILPTGRLTRKPAEGGQGSR